MTASGLRRVMIIAGESSGELYGALLARTLMDRNPGVEITGVGGERMEAAGVSLISPIASSFGFTEAIRTFGELKKTYSRVVETLRTFSPQVLVLIDYPDFNLRVAPVAKKMGIRVLYYVSPQIWAWRKGRINTIGRVIDRMAAILPFEEAIYREKGIPCEFVGHPAMDEIREILSEVRSQNTEDREQNTEFRTQNSEPGAFRLQPTDTSRLAPHLKRAVRLELGLDPDRPLVTVMPGSRRHEIMRLLPALSGFIREMRSSHPGWQFLVPVAPNLEGRLVSLIHRELEHATVIPGNSIKALLSADTAVIASGTSTLQATLLGVPAVVVYKLSSCSSLIVKLVVKVRHISLANIILDHMEGVPPLRVRELVQANVREDAIRAEIMKISDDEGHRQGLTGQMERVSRLFDKKSASLRVAEMAEELAGGV